MQERVLYECIKLRFLFFEEEEIHGGVIIFIKTIVQFNHSSIYFNTEDFEHYTFQI